MEIREIIEIIIIPVILVFIICLATIKMYPNSSTK